MFSFTDVYPHANSTYPPFLSAVHNPPGALLDAAHPLKVHFDSYNTDKKIKSVRKIRLNHCLPGLIDLF